CFLHLLIYLHSPESNRLVTRGRCNMWYLSSELRALPLTIIFLALSFISRVIFQSFGNGISDCPYHWVSTNLPQDFMSTLITFTPICYSFFYFFIRRHMVIIIDYPFYIILLSYFNLRNILKISFLLIVHN